MGTCIGFLSGIFGIGGSLISTPILRLVFNIPELIALASPLPVTIPTAISGAYSYSRKGCFNKKIAFYTIILGLPATVIGAWCTKYIEAKSLMIFTGALIVTLGIRFLRSDIAMIPKFIKQCPSSLQAGLIGIISGFLSGLLAVGGGFFLVPAFVMVMGLTMQEAAATSLICVAVYAVPGTLVHWYLNHIDWSLVLNLSIGVIPASYLGAHLATNIKSQKLQNIFSIFLILFGFYFIFKQIKGF